MRVSSSGAAVVAALVCVAALPARALAEPVAGQDQNEARRLFQKAELGFNLGKFEDALADYQAAYQAKPLPGFLFNIAQCYRNLGNWERARFFYRRYLTLEPRSPNRHRVEDLVSEMTARLEKQEAQSASDRPIAPNPAGPGSTEPPAVAPSAAAPSSVAPVAAAPVVNAPAPLPAVDAEAALSPPASASATLVSAPPTAPRRPVYKRWWFWSGVGVVVVGGVVAGLVLARPTTKTPGTLDPIDAR